MNIIADYEKSDYIRSDCITVCVMRRIQINSYDVNLFDHSFLSRKKYFNEILKFNKSKKVKNQNIDI